MLSKNEVKTVSRLLSLVLRHSPETLDLKLDANGWSNVDTLLENLNKIGHHIDFHDLQTIVNTNSKKRFAFDDLQERIRANQGHSLDVDLGLTSTTPPENLYHGTASQFLNSIISTGLQKQSRQYVHLSEYKETVLEVGRRQGTPLLIEVKSLNMYNDGFKFFKSDNNVWLTEIVPAQYLSIL